MKVTNTIKFAVAKGIVTIYNNDKVVTQIDKEFLKSISKQLIIFLKSDLLNK